MQYRLERRQRVSVQVDRARVAVLRFIQIDCATASVKLARLDAVLLRESHPCVYGSHVLRQMLRETPRDHLVEYVVFFAAQEAETASRLFAHRDELASRWIVGDFLVSLAQLVCQAEERLVTVECCRCLRVSRQPGFNVLRRQGLRIS